MNVVKILALTIATLLSVPATAELKIKDAPAVCSVLADLGLKGRKWVDYGDGTAGCASDYKDIGSSSGLPNNLAYYATGSGSSAAQVKLVLNYNQPSQAAKATPQLLKAADRLSALMLGAPLPASIKNAVSNGKPVKERLGAGEIEVTRDNWPTGKGYEVHVILR